MRIAVHRCSKCLNELKNTSVFSLNGMEDKLISFNIGNFGIILTRKYLVYMTLSVFAIILLYLAISASGGAHDHDSRPITDISWQDFISECGQEAFQKDPRRSQRSFESKFLEKGIYWDGFVVRVNYLDDMVNKHFHESSILVKMQPPDNINGISLGLTFSEHSFAESMDVIKTLELGQHIGFNATIMGMGDSNHVHHLHAFGVEILDGKIEVPALVHNHGRYKYKG